MFESEQIYQIHPPELRAQEERLSGHFHDAFLQHPEVIVILQRGPFYHEQ